MVMKFFNSKKSDKEEVTQEKRLEEKIKREMQYKSFQKNIEKLLKESEQKLEQYKTMAIEAKKRDNKSQVVAALKYMKFVQFNIDRAQSLKFQLDMAFMNTNFSSTMRDFVTSLSSFAEGMKLEGVTPGEMAKNFSRFSMETQKFSSQIERFDSFIEDTESVFDDLMPSEETISEADIDQMFNELNIPSKTSVNVSKIDELLKDLKD